LAKRKSSWRALSAVSNEAMVIRLRPMKAIPTLAVPLSDTPLRRGRAVEPICPPADILSVAVHRALGVSTYGFAEQGGVVGNAAYG
jgi:hypothetical protein